MAMALALKIATSTRRPAISFGGVNSASSDRSCANIIAGIKAARSVNLKCIASDPPPYTTYISTSISTSYIMGWFSDDSYQAQSYNDMQSSPHQASWSHEAIAAAASYEAAKAYENHCRENGQPSSHEKAKEIFAGFAGAFVDREVETRGLDAIDKARAKHDATQHASEYIYNDYN